MNDVLTISNEQVHGVAQVSNTVTDMNHIIQNNTLMVNDFTTDVLASEAQIVRFASLINCDFFVAKKDTLKSKTAKQAAYLKALTV
ncbi:MAG: hypothetical protein ACFC03_00745 [Candidatus Malihini olakiniferum]